MIGALRVALLASVVSAGSVCSSIGRNGAAAAGGSPSRSAPHFAWSSNTLELNGRARAGSPAVNIAAFRGQGHLAFLWGGLLYLLDGDRGSLRQITRSGQASGLAWSPDGRWLAYTTGGVSSANGQLWMVGVNGSAARRIAEIPGPLSTLHWAPRTDVLAIELPGVRHTSALWLISPTGRMRRIAASGDPIWSPDGKTLAYVETLPYTQPETRTDALYTVPVAGGAPTLRYKAASSGIWTVRWWPDGLGLSFWIDVQHSESFAADGLGLYTMRLGAAPRLLTYALTYRSWQAWPPAGPNVLLIAHGGREIWHDKVLAVCDVIAARCHELAQPRGTVSLDPAWSPAGGRIAFVRARDLGLIGGFADARGVLSWVRSRALWTSDAHGGGARAIAAAGHGIYEPQWSADGHHLMYVRDNSLWLIDTNSGVPTRIVGPFPTEPDLFPVGYYGHLSWAATVAWSK